MTALLKRELRATLRDAWTFGLLLLAAGFTMLVVISGAGRGQGQMQELLMGAYMLTWLSVPGLAATAFAEERAQGTLDMLRMTGLGPATLLCAKFGRVLALYALFGLGVLPAAGALLFYVGADPAHLTGAAALMIPLAVALAGLGLFFGLWCGVPVRAVFWTYALAFVLGNTGVWLALGPDTRIILPARVLAPMLALFDRRLESRHWAALIGGQAVAAVLFTGGALWLLSRRGETARRARRPGRRPGSARRPIPRWANPVLWKDLDSAFITSRAWLLFLFLVMFCAVAIHGPLREYWRAGAGLLEIGPLLAAALLGPGFAGVLLTREYDPEGGRRLEMTPLRAGALARGKWAAACAPFLALAAGGYAGAQLLGELGLLTQASNWQAPDSRWYTPREILAAGFAAQAAAIPVLLALALLGASCARRAGPSIVLAYAALFAPAFILPSLNLGPEWSRTVFGVDLGDALRPGALGLLGQPPELAAALAICAVQAAVLYPLLHLRAP